MTKQPELPYLKLISPENETFVFSLKEKEYLTIGRDKNNDVPLDDPQKFISRQHCRLHKEVGYFWIIDDNSGPKGKPSASGTFFRSANGGEDIDVREKGRLRLEDGDMFYLLAKVVPPDDTPVFWQFTFYESNTTLDGEIPPSFLSQQVIPDGKIAYSLNSQLLVRSTGNRWEPIILPPKPLSFIRYMVQKNQDNEGQSVLCTYLELIAAVWQEESFGKKNKDINHLVWQIRKKIEDDPSEPRYIKNVMSDGYILDIDLQ